MIKHISGKILLGACALFLQFSTAQAQNPESTRALFPDANVAYSSYEKVLTLMKKDGIPYAESEYNIEMMMLTDKNSNMISRYRVYHSGYSELANLDAYTKVPTAKNKYRNVKVQDYKTTSSTSSNVFYDDNKESSFDFPNLVQDAVACVNYKLKHKDAHLLMPFYIPDNLPIHKAQFRVEVPEGIFIK